MLGTFASLLYINDHFVSSRQAASKVEQIGLKHVIRQRFANETVEIDGKEFNSCVFENVTLVYRGSPFRLDRNKIIGILTIKTTHRAARLLEFLNDLDFVQYQNKNGGVLRLHFEDEL